MERDRRPGRKLASVLRGTGLRDRPPDQVRQAFPAGDVIVRGLRQQLRPVGRGSGCHGSSMGSTARVSVTPSTAFRSIATAAVPSATAWWIFTTTATRSRPALEDQELPQRPVPRQRLACERGHRLASCRSLPGSASTIRVRWRPSSNSGSSTQTGWSRPPGTGTIRRRKAGEPDEVPEDVGQVVVGVPGTVS